MKSLIYLFALLSFIAPYIEGPGINSLAQERKTHEAEDDHVYASREVDVPAKITNKMENLPEPGKDCPHAGLVRLKITLHRSGDVTEVAIIKGMGCSYDEATVEAARKFKFIPAVKDGKQVSEYKIFEYQYR
jgi:TonB family protein